MPFALVPEGFELKKVTKLQKQAVDKYYRSNSVNTFLANPESLIFISGLVAAYLGTRAAANVIDDLKDKGIAITDSAKESIEQTLSTGTTKFIETARSEQTLNIAREIIKATGGGPIFDPFFKLLED